MPNNIVNARAILRCLPNSIFADILASPHILPFPDTLYICYRSQQYCSDRFECPPFSSFPPPAPLDNVDNVDCSKLIQFFVNPLSVQLIVNSRYLVDFLFFFFLYFSHLRRSFGRCFGDKLAKRRRQNNYDQVDQCVASGINNGINIIRVICRSTLAERSILAAYFNETEQVILG